MNLTEDQLSTLSNFLSEILESLFLDNVELTVSENEFTASHLFPWVKEKINTLKKQGLYVRGEGGPAVQPLIWQGVSFLPDISVDFFSTKAIAFEIKIIRNSDPTGSFSKAIGQTLIYSIAGYYQSFALVFDFRNPAKSKSTVKFSNSLELTDRCKLFYYNAK